MRSTLNLNIELTHDRNLPTPDADGIAAQVEAFLFGQLAAHDPLASARVLVRNAVIHGRVEMTVQAVNN